MAENDDHQHWPDENTHYAEAQPLLGFDTHNGLRTYSYNPQTVEPAPGYQLVTPGATFQTTYPDPIHTQQLYVHPPGPYAILPYQAAPMVYHYPMMYGYPANQHGLGGHANATPSTNAAPNVWIGRTKAQVDEDNMKIAKAEGAYNPRKIVPVGLQDDQMIWVIELDGSFTLHSFATVKTFQGEWKPDPRFDRAWYFQREEEGKNA